MEYVNFVEKNIDPMRSDHDIPATQGAREAKAILLNGTDQSVSETYVGPLEKKVA